MLRASETQRKSTVSRPFRRHRRATAMALSLDAVLASERLNSTGAYAVVLRALGRRSRWPEAVELFLEMPSKKVGPLGLEIEVKRGEMAWKRHETASFQPLSRPQVTFQGLPFRAPKRPLDLGPERGAARHGGAEWRAEGLRGGLRLVLGAAAHVGAPHGARPALYGLPWSTSGGVDMYSIELYIGAVSPPGS